jgi:transposase
VAGEQGPAGRRKRKLIKGKKRHILVDMQGLLLHGIVTSAAFKTATGFVVLPKRWIVERTIGWINRCRRLAKDWENLNRNALAFLKLASIRLMLRKLCNS